MGNQCLEKEMQPTEQETEKQKEPPRRKPIKIVLLVLLVLFVLGGAAAGVQRYRTLHRYDSAVYTTVFHSSNHKKWWLETTADPSAFAAGYAKTRQQAKKVLLTPAYFGGTVYLDAAGAPFVVNGNRKVSLEKGTDGKWTVPAADTACFRAEYSRQEVKFTATPEAARQLNDQIKKASGYAPSGKDGIVYIADSRYIGSVRTYTDPKKKKDTLFFAADDVLKPLAVTFAPSKDGNSVTFSFLDAAQNRHRFTVAVARADYQPWTDSSTGNVYPALVKKGGVYYLPEQMLAHLFGFDVTFSSGTLTVVALHEKSKKFA